MCLLHMDAIEGDIMRLIDADALCTLKFQEPICQHAYDTAYRVGWNDAVDKVGKYAPTIDAVEVVRCRECKWLMKWSDGEQTCRRIGVGYIVGDEDYCSYGKRREPKECDTCIHKDEPWHSDACDGCCKAHSSYQSIPTEKSADIPSE